MAQKNNIKIKKVLVVGLGLIGASLCRDLKKNSNYEKIYGHDTDAVAMSYALNNNYVHEIRKDLEEGIKDSDLIVLCAPVHAITKVLDVVKYFFNGDKVFTDTLSSKNIILKYLSDNKISNTKNVLEIGTFTGLSALTISLALPDDGKLIALDKNEETNKVASSFFKKANQDHKIKTIIKPALESLDDLKNNKFDMIFIDADKMNYKEYYERSLKLINKGGLIIIDNVLWHGEVADEDNLDKYTVNIREFNSHVSNDNRVEQIIVPLGDGMTVCRVL